MCKKFFKEIKLFEKNVSHTKHFFYVKEKKSLTMLFNIYWDKNT